MGEVVFKVNLVKGVECLDDWYEIVCMYCVLVFGIEFVKFLFGEIGKGVEDGYEYYFYIDIEYIGLVIRRVDFLGDGDIYCCSMVVGNIISLNLR